MDTLPHDELSRRDRKKLQTRDALALAALELFESQGFTATTIEDITNRADVARRTFFRHFSNKEATLLPHPDEYEQILADILDSVTPPITFDNLMQTFIAASRQHASDRVLQQRRIKIISANRLHIGLGAWESLLTVRDNISAKLAQVTNTSDTDDSLTMMVDLVIFTMTTAHVYAAESENAHPIEAAFEHVYAMLTKVANNEVSLGGTSDEPGDATSTD